MRSKKERPKRREESKTAARPAEKETLAKMLTRKRDAAQADVYCSSLLRDRERKKNESIAVTREKNHVTDGSTKYEPG